MAINLQKGQRIDIGLSKIGVGLGWDPNTTGGSDFDLDASAFMIGTNKKIPSDEYLVFYNNPLSPDGALKHSGDDRTGGNSDGDDETLLLNIAKLNPTIQEIVFVVTIYEYEARRQNFGQVRNSFIRIYDEASGEEIAKYELDEDFSVETAVEFGRLYKKDNKWRFEAMGVGHKCGLQHFVDRWVG